MGVVMNKKAINAVITKKISGWLASIEDKNLAADLENEVIVTGGCIASMLCGEQVNDFDVYLKSKSAVRRVSEYYCRKFNERNTNNRNKLGYKAEAFVLDGEFVERWKNGEIEIDDIAPGYSNQGEPESISRMITSTSSDRIKIIVRSDGIAEDSEAASSVELVENADEIPASALDEAEQYQPTFLTSNAITLSGKVQIVIRFYGDPDSIHDNYDFAHCTNYWTFGGGLVLKQDALESILSRELIYKGSKYPLCSIIRTRKFINRGFHVNAGQYLKMCFQLSELDLKNIDVLEDQLVGVDSMYFKLLIEAMQAKAEKDKEFVVSASYIATVVDKIF